MTTAVDRTTRAHDDDTAWSSHRPEATASRRSGFGYGAGRADMSIWWADGEQRGDHRANRAKPVERLSGVGYLVPLEALERLAKLRLGLVAATQLSARSVPVEGHRTIRDTIQPNEWKKYRVRGG